jgi:hypothetical protein
MLDISREKREMHFNVDWIREKCQWWIDLSVGLLASEFYKTQTLQKKTIGPLARSLNKHIWQMTRSFNSFSIYLTNPG